MGEENWLPFAFELIAPPAALAQRVNTFFLLETSTARFEEIIPAYSAQLLIFVRGSLRVHYGGGEPGISETVTIIAPQLRAAPCMLDGPATIIGASLTPLGWLALANLAVDDVHDRFVPARTILSGEQITSLERQAAICLHGTIEPLALCETLGQIIGAGPHPLRPEHVKAVAAMTCWLASGFDPSLGELHAAVDVSPRQLQRLSRRYYGVPPAQVLKRHRAIRAAMLLANPALPEHLREAALVPYFDQAHLIRDMRRYTGKTPGQLRYRAIAGNTFDPAGHGDAAVILRQAPPRSLP